MYNGICITSSNITILYIQGEGKGIYSQDNGDRTAKKFEQSKARARQRKGSQSRIRPVEVVYNRGAMFMLCSSWKSSFAAYGMYSCETAVFVLHARHSNVCFFCGALSVQRSAKE